jgi:hypothetical protein
MVLDMDTIQYMYSFITILCILTSEENFLLPSAITWFFSVELLSFFRDRLLFSRSFFCVGLTFGIVLFTLLKNGLQGGAS